jgi:drug/metabolite transporter (DMT)-like permease
MWLTVSLCSIGLGLFTEEWVMIKGSQWLGLIWLGVVVDAVAYLLWAKALKGADDSSKIANLAYLTPFLSIIVSAIVLKEEITLRALIALLFIVGGILFPTFFEFVKKKANK